MKKYIPLIFVNMIFLIISSLVVFQIHIKGNFTSSFEDFKIDFDHLTSEANQIDDIEYLREKYLLSLKGYQSTKEALEASFEAAKWSVYGITFVTMFNLFTVIMIGLSFRRRTMPTN